jgi:diacylglycerol kinase
MNLTKLLRSFVIGSVGFAHALRTEQNMWLHLLAAVGVVALGLWLKLAAGEWVAIVVAIGLVISAECVNTALERLADRVSREHDPLIKQAKDCGSAAVLVLAITAAVVGGIVFGPKLWAAAGWAAGGW